MSIERRREFPALLMITRLNTCSTGYEHVEETKKNAKVIFGFYFIKNTVNGLSQLGIPKNFKLD